MQLNELTIEETHKGLVEKNFSAKELAAAFFKRIKDVDGKVKAYITVTEKVALSQASEVDKKLKNGQDIGMLEGVPCAVKDIILTEGVLSTAASNMLKNYIPPFDATIIKKLKQEGLVMAGKTNLDAFAHGASTENSDFFTTHNPWDLDRVAGGSSGGSAAAISAGEASYSLGTDTGGSIRGPASFCGTVGLKPTYGRVSRYGLIAMTSSTDCPGPITKNVMDSAIVLDAISGKDIKDSATVDTDKQGFADKIKTVKDLKGLKIGIPNEYFISGMNPNVEKSVRNAILSLEKLGAEISGVSLPHTKYAVPTYYIITPSEVSSNLSRYDGIRFGYSAVNDKDIKEEVISLGDIYAKSRRYGFGAEAKRRIMLGTYALSAGYYDAYYLKAQKVRTLIKQDFDKVFEKFDCLVTPTCPNVAFKIGAHRDNPLEMYLEDIFSSAVSLAGLPAISVPCGFVAPEDGAAEMPVGLQIIGKAFDELTILKTAYVYEQNSAWKERKPAIAA